MSIWQIVLLSEVNHLIGKISFQIKSYKETKCFLKSGKMDFFWIFSNKFYFYFHALAPGLTSFGYATIQWGQPNSIIIFLWWTQPTRKKKIFTDLRCKICLHFSPRKKSISNVMDHREAVSVETGKHAAAKITNLKKTFSFVIMKQNKVK